MIISNYAKDIESPSYASGVVGYTGNYNWDQQTVNYCLNAGSVTNNASIGEELQVAYTPFGSYFYIEGVAFEAATDALYEGAVEELTSLLNTGLEPGSEFWGVVEGVVKPLVLTD